MGISLPSVIERKNDQLVITARVVVKTSDSDYVDGMDIAFSLEPIIDPNYYRDKRCLSLNLFNFRQTVPVT